MLVWAASRRGVLCAQVRHEIHNCHQLSWEGENGEGFEDIIKILWEIRGVVTI